MLLPERWEKFLVLVATKGQHMMAKAVKMLQLDYHVLHGSRLWTGWVGAEAAAPKLGIPSSTTTATALWRSRIQ